MLDEMGASVQSFETVPRGAARRAAGLIAALTLFRIFYAGTFELAGDEAYYWLWSRRPDIGYYSKGPGVAWTIAASTRLFGDSERAVRLPAVLLSAVSAGWIWRLTRRLFGGAAAERAVIVASTVPLFLAGSLLMTIDPLSVAAWLAAAAAFLDAVETDRPRAWLAAGAAVAAGTLCKFTNLAQLPCFALAAAATPGWRRHLRQPGFWGMIAIGLAGLLPPLLWNAQHGWVTVRHLWERGGLDRAARPNPLELLEFLAGQMGVLSPVYAVALVAAAARADLRMAQPQAARFLGALILPLPVVYAVLSLNGEHEPNWTAPALALCPVALAGLWTTWLERRPEWRRRAALVVAAHALLAAVAHLVLAGPWIFGNDRFRRIGGAADLAARVESARREAGADFVVAGGYQLASLLSYYTPGHPEVFVPLGGRPDNQFAFWPGYAPRFAGRDAIYVGRGPDVPASLRRQFRAVREIGPVESFYRGRRMRPHYLFQLMSLRAAPESRPARTPEKSSVQGDPVGAVTDSHPPSIRGDTQTGPAVGTVTTTRSSRSENQPFSTSASRAAPLVSVHVR